MSSSILLCVLVLIIFFALIYIVGYGCLNLVKIKLESIAERIFLSSLLGLILITFLYSFFKTEGKTILALLLIPLGFIILTKAKPDLSNPQNEKGKTYTNIWFHLAFTGIFLFLFQCCFCYDFIHQWPINPVNDNVFYSTLSDYLRIQGKENFSLEYIYSDNYGNMPYHYFELWITALLTQITSLHSLIIYEFVTITLLRTMVVLGLFAIGDKLKHRLNISILFVCFLGLFLTGLNFSIYEKTYLLSGASNFALNGILYPKLLPIYLFLTAALLLYLRRNFKEVFYLLLSIPIINISTAPSIFMALTTFLMLNLIFKWIHFPNKLLPWIGVFSTAIAIGLFYKLLGSNNTTASPALLGEIINFKYFLTIINIIGGTVIRLCTLYFPLIIILALCILKNEKITRDNLLLFFLKIYRDKYFLAGIVLFFLLLICGMLSWGIFHHLVDSIQLFQNIGNTLINLTLLIFILFLLKRYHPQKEKFRILVLGISLISLLTIISTLKILSGNKTYQLGLYSESYMDKIKQDVKDLNPKGAFIMARTDYTDVFSKNPLLNAPGAYLGYMLPYKSLTSLSVLEMPLSEDKRLKDFEENMVKNSTFYKYVSKEKDKDRFITIDSCKRSFLKNYRIDYLIATKNANVNFIKSSEIKKIIINPKTGERFIFIKM